MQYLVLHLPAAELAGPCMVPSPNSLSESHNHNSFLARFFQCESERGIVQAVKCCFLGTLQAVKDILSFDSWLQPPTFRGGRFTQKNMDIIEQGRAWSKNSEILPECMRQWSCKRSTCHFFFSGGRFSRFLNVRQINKDCYYEQASNKCKCKVNFLI